MGTTEEEIGPGNVMMSTAKGKRIPDRSRPGLTTTAPLTDVNQGGSDKSATGDTTKPKELKLPTEGITVGTWNVRTLYATGKMEELCHEMIRYKWNVLGISEVRWLNFGEITTDEGHKLWYSGEQEKHELGVAIMVHKDTANSVISWQPVSSRIITVRLSCMPQNLSIVQVYAPTSNSSEEKCDDFYSELEEVISNIPKKDILIIQGDWNAKIGPDAYADWAGTVGKFPWGETNERGLRLLEFARLHNLTIANTLFPHKASRRTTWHSPNGQFSNQIDFILTSKRFKSGINANKTRTFPGADIGSDHDLVMMTMKTRLSRRSKPKNPRIRFNLEKLNDKSIAEEFQAKIGGKFAPLLLVEDIDELTEGFNQALTEVAQEVLGKQRKKKQPWISNETLDLCDKRREKKSKRKNGPAEKEEYKNINAEVRNKLRTDKDTWINQQCETLEAEITKNNTKKAFDIVKKLTKGYIARATVIEDKNGKMLTEKSQVVDRWREYCEELYNYRGDNNIPTRLANEQDQEDDPPITLEEVIGAVRDLKQGKAPGVDNIPAELLTNAGEISYRVLWKICTEVWNKGKWPKTWTKSLIITMPKKGNLKKCNNYRTISLISHPSKVLLRIMLSRLKAQAESLLAEEQAGFRTGRSTTEQIFNLRIISEKFMAHNRELHHNFIDFTKAFDRVWHQGLWAVLGKYNISKTLVGCIKSLYQDARSAVLIENTLSSWFNTSTGVRQGCLLSPVLFNLFLENIMSEALQSFKGTVSVGGRDISNLRFADDIDLMAGSRQELKELTALVDKTCTDYGMEISTEKSKLMAMGTELEQPEIKVRGKSLEQVDSFKYLGAQITKDGRSDTEIKSRLAVATSALAKLQPLLNNKSISIRTKIRLLRAIVIATALYGCEAWTLSAETERRIQAFEFRCLRRLLKVSYTEHRTNESIRAEIIKNIGPHEPLITIVKKRKMQFYGHTNRAGNLATTILQGSVDGNRGRGRPRTTWLKNIVDWSGLEVNNLHTLSLDRQTWKRTIDAVAHDAPTTAAVKG
jgi:exonuclease III